MKKTILATAAAVLVTGSVAGAADLSAPMYTKAPPYAAPMVLWNGFYIGGHVGYAWQDLSASVTGIALPAIPRPDGIFGGGQIGYNFQLAGPFVLGVEADVSAGDINDSVTIAGVTGRSRTDTFGTVRGRLGYSFGPTLVYVTGGYAWADNRLSVTGPGLAVSESRSVSGYALGGGLEYMFAPGWSVKAEYIYMGFDRASYTFGGLLAAPGDLRVRTDQHTVKLGVNYHFNWGAPVVARY